MPVKEILLLGNPQLYEISFPVKKDELEHMEPLILDLNDTLTDFRKKHNAGRAIAAPQIGIRKRVLYINIDRPMIVINPAIEAKSYEMIEIWDDCMSFPDLLVKVKRHRSCAITFRNMNWELQTMNVDGDFSELLQHEYDHLEGILAVSRAIDRHSFALRSQRNRNP
jgi:peptide deformylase